MNYDTGVATQEAIDTIMETCNVMGAEKDLAKMIAKTLSKEHRTIQQSFVGVIYSALVQYGEQNAEYFDARNEASVKFCKTLKEMEVYFPFV